jgi:hypothetical protein
MTRKVGSAKVASRRGEDGRCGAESPSKNARPFRKHGENAVPVDYMHFRASSRQVDQRGPPSRAAARAELDLPETCYSASHDKARSVEAELNCQTSYLRPSNSEPATSHDHWKRSWNDRNGRASLRMMHAHSKTPHPMCKQRPLGRIGWRTTCATGNDVVRPIDMFPNFAGIFSWSRPIIAKKTSAIMPTGH